VTFHNSTIAFKRSQTNHRRKKKSRHLLSALVGIALCFIATGCSESASNHCVMNLRGIEAAKRQWRVENSKSEEDAPTWEEIGPYRGKLPKCPSNGIYKLGKVKEKPTARKAAESTNCQIQGRPPIWWRAWDCSSRQRTDRIWAPNLKVLGTPPNSRSARPSTLFALELSKLRTDPFKNRPVHVHVHAKNSLIH